MKIFAPNQINWSSAHSTSPCTRATWAWATNALPRKRSCRSGGALLALCLFFSKLPLLFPVREWNSRVWWIYGIESQIETFRFQHWKKFRNVNVQLQTNVDLWLNEKLIDFANAMIFQKTSRTLYEKNKELHVWKIFEKKGPAIRSIFSFFPDFFVRPILNSKKKYLWIFISVSGISIFSVKLT